MTTCDEFQIAVEMRRHGTLDAEVSSALDEHLASCEACRRYAGLGERVESAMHAATTQVAANINWSAMKSEMSGRARRYLRTPLWMAAAATLLISWLAVRGVQTDDFSAVPLGAALAVVLVLGAEGARDALRQWRVVAESLRVRRGRV